MMACIPVTLTFRRMRVDPERGFTYVEVSSGGYREVYDVPLEGVSGYDVEPVWQSLWGSRPLPAMERGEIWAAVEEALIEAADTGAAERVFLLPDGWEEEDELGAEWGARWDEEAEAWVVERLS
ncbi:MAG: hypothetical protein ACTSSA_12075 [Candidatus Freyarchaeota archaeon]